MFVVDAGAVVTTGAVLSAGDPVLVIVNDAPAITGAVFSGGRRVGSVLASMDPRGDGYVVAVVSLDCGARTARTPDSARDFGDIALSETHAPEGRP